MVLRLLHLSYKLNENLIMRLHQTIHVMKMKLRRDRH